MISIEKHQNKSVMHITTNGNTGDFIALSKTLTNSLAQAQTQEDKQVLCGLMNDILPNEHQLKLE